MERSGKLRNRSLYMLHVFLIPVFLPAADILLNNGNFWMMVAGFLTGTLEIESGSCLGAFLILVLWACILIWPAAWLLVIIPGCIKWGIEEQINWMWLLGAIGLGWAIVKKVIEAVETADEELKDRARLLAWRATRYPLLAGFVVLVGAGGLFREPSEASLLKGAAVAGLMAYPWALLQMRGLWEEGSSPVVTTKATSSPEPEAPDSESRMEPSTETLDRGTLRLGQHTAIANEARDAHLYVIGATRAGKSKALESWIRQDISAGRGVGVIDPHGELYQEVLNYCAASEELSSRLILVDLTDPKYTVGFNPLEVTRALSPARQALELMGVFRQIWRIGMVAARMEEILRNTIMALMEYNLTMDEIPRFLAPGNKELRAKMVSGLENQNVKRYWKERFEPLRKTTKAEWVESTLNKVNSFLIDPAIREMVAQRESTIDLREIMDRKKVLLVNLAKGELGEENSFLLGALFLAKLQMAAMSRVNVPENQRPPFYLYVDEFQNFATETFATILSEAAKYGLSLTLAHQTLSQLHEVPKLRGAVLANAKNQVYFRVGREDAEVLAKEMFFVSGRRVKAKSTNIVLLGKIPWAGQKKLYYSTSEEWDLNYQKLMGLPQRAFWLNVKDSEEYYRDTTVEVSSCDAGLIRVWISSILEDLEDRGYLRSRAEVRKEMSGRDEVVDEMMAREGEDSEVVYYDEGNPRD